MIEISSNVLLINRETTYVVDRGYFDYKLLDRLHNNGYIFVNRIRSNTKITFLDQIEHAHVRTTDGQVISDQQVILGGSMNYHTERFRLVTILTKGKKFLRLITTRFDITPNEVADMYQACWQIIPISV
ncbi:transposase [Enterococcus sp. DIV0187]|uniref:transposase n=1 Tax=Enterococcus sp. DIV0187 TaxID=2774644 RepID=UPI003F6875A9